VEISYQLTTDDYRQGFKAFRKRTTYSLWMNRFAKACFVVVVAAALLISVFARRVSNPLPLYGIAFFWAWYL
jgi:hypothetical protein